MREEERVRRKRDITTLLSYPGVGALTLGAIRINLGADEEDVREALEALLVDGKVTRAGTTPVPHLRGDAVVSVDEEQYTVPGRVRSERP